MKMGFGKKYEPTQEHRQIVQLHAMVGTDHQNIAKALGIDSKTLRKYFREELDLGLAKANAAIGGALFNKAKGGDTTAMIFWLKTRARWRETNHHDHTSSDGSMSPREITIKPVHVKSDD